MQGPPTKRGDATVSGPPLPMIDRDSVDRHAEKINGLVKQVCAGASYRIALILPSDCLDRHLLIA